MLGVVLILLGFLSLLIWLDQKWAAIPLIAYFSIAFIFAVVVLFREGLSLLSVCRPVMYGFFVAALIRWAREPSEDETARHLELFEQD